MGSLLLHLLRRRLSPHPNSLYFTRLHCFRMILLILVQYFLVIEGSNSCICDECKEVLDGKFAGPWDLVESGSDRCDGGCLYSNTSSVEICMCNPGPVRYQACS